MRLPYHAIAHLGKTCVPQRNGGISVVEKWVDDLSFFQTSQGTVLPKDWSNIRGGSKKSLVAQPQCFMTKFKSIIKDFPELVQAETLFRCILSALLFGVMSTFFVVSPSPVPFEAEIFPVCQD